MNLSFLSYHCLCPIEFLAAFNYIICKKILGIAGSLENLLVTDGIELTTSQSRVHFSNHYDATIVHQLPKLMLARL